MASESYHEIPSRHICREKNLASIVEGGWAFIYPKKKKDINDKLALWFCLFLS